MVCKWSDDGKSMHCDDCNRDFSTEGCDHAFGCLCDAHSHYEFHMKWDIVKANPTLGKMTINELEGYDIDE